MHLTVVAFSKEKIRGNQFKETIINVRDKRPSSIRRLGRFLCEVPWDIVVNPNQSCDQNLNNFTDVIKYGLNTLMPLKNVKVHLNDQPWMNSNLKRLIKKRQKALAQNNHALYKQLRNKVNRSRKNCRKLYYEAKVKELKHTKPKDWWKEVKRLCGHQQKSTSNIFANLQQDTQDLDSLSNLINDCFLEPMCYYQPLSDSTITMTDNNSIICLTEEEVFKSLNGVKLGKSSGPDCLPNWVLRKFAVILAMPISIIINTSFKENRVPACWKLANICPIPKVKQVIDVNKDLRPVSLTSTLSKIVEDAVIKYDLKPAIMDRLDCNQYGFIPGSNTTLALITLIHRWSKTVDKEGGCVPSLVTDYRKAFDLIDHNTLYEKLQGIGLKTSTLNWISDFLRGRLQRVKLSPNCFSNWKPVNAGVPQGTKLGPWLFLLMINDLVVSNDQFDGDMMKYADDTNVSEYITDQAENSSLQEVTNSIVDWSERNKFQLNPSKCKEFVVSFKRNEPNFSPISINESQIERADKLSI